MLHVHLLQVRAHLQQYTLEAQAERTPDGQKAVLLRQDSKVGVVYQREMAGTHFNSQHHFTATYWTCPGIANHCCMGDKAANLVTPSNVYGSPQDLVEASCECVSLRVNLLPVLPTLS